MLPLQWGRVWPLVGELRSLHATQHGQKKRKIVFSLFFLIKFIYLFIFGWVGSSLLPVGSLQLRWAGATLRRGARAPHCSGLPRCGAWALGVRASAAVAHGLSSYGSWAPERRLISCGARAQPLRSMWDPPEPGIEPVSPHVLWLSLGSSMVLQEQCFILFHGEYSIVYMDHFFFAHSSGTRWPSLVSHQHDLRHKPPCLSILSLSYLLKQLAHSPQDCRGFGRRGPSRAGSLSEAALLSGSGAPQWRRREETPSREFQLCGNAGSVLGEEVGLPKNSILMLLLTMWIQLQTFSNKCFDKTFMYYINENIYALKIGI